MSGTPQLPVIGAPRIPTKVSSTRITKKKTTVRTTSSEAGPSEMRAQITPSTGAIPKTKPPPDKTKKAKEFALPAFSTMTDKEKQGETELDKLKKKNIRRVIAEGEDIKAIKDILKGIRDQDIVVQEFVIKIGPHTGDNGDGLRHVMADELGTFRKLALRVYETMTQDVSDVLTNEHAELLEYYREKIEYFSNKTAQCIFELYEICPDFNFDHYYSDDRERYLHSLFPIPEEEDIDPEELEMHKRQQMYHRLQWLRTEGERLNAENKKLQKRLTELKRQQKEELRAANAAMQQAEERKQQLEQAEAQIGQQLDVINESLEKSIIDQERQRSEIQGARSKTLGAKKKTTTRRSSMQKPEWNVGAAAEIEGTALQETVQSEVTKASLSTSQTSAKKRASKAKFKKSSSKTGEGAFHFSPIKTPPPKDGAKKETSPFHYSPPKTPPEARAPVETTRVETTTVVTEETASAAPPRLGRRPATAPKDSWGGFK